MTTSPISFTMGEVVSLYLSRLPPAARSAMELAQTDMLFEYLEGKR